MSPPAVLRTVWWLAGLALVLGWLREPILGLQPRPRELPRLDNRTGMPWLDGDFAPHTLGPGELPGHIRRASSWVGTDEFTGRAETAWFKASRRTVYVGVGGYPRHAGCELWAEFRDAAGAITRIDCRIVDPREEWSLWEIRRPAGAVAVRIVGHDRAADWCGWFAFSHPFRRWPPELETAYQFAQIATTLALALALLWGPGLLLCPRAATPATRTAYFLGAGPLLLAAGGIAVWSTSGLASPQAVGTGLVAALWLWLGRRARAVRWAPEWPPLFGRVLALTALVVVAVGAKSFYSVGPEGELFRGAVSRNLALSDRIDSRFNYYAVQAAAHHWGPASPATEKFYYPWTFFSRGPLAGLAAIPVVMATNGRPPAELPDHRWSPFDRSGFAAYRLTLMVLASGVIGAFFLMLGPLVGDRWALVGGGLLALAPFGVHEIMFTWPKWIATAWLATAFALVHDRRPAAGGLALGLGFLFHPLVLLWTPWLGLWALGRAERRAADLVATGLRFGACAGAIVVPWMLLGAWMPHLPDTPFAGQSNFTRYWTLADSQHATWATWRQTRWMNFANTFVPLHVLLDPASAGHFRLNSGYEPSGLLAKTTFLWWNTLPFALGLGLWAAAGFAVVRGLRTLRAATWLFVLGPAVLLGVYWGGDPLGLMRECGHPLFLAVIAVTVIVAARTGGRFARLLGHRAVPWLQLPETWLMLWLATLGNPRPWAVTSAHFDPAMPVVNALALGAAAWVLTRPLPRSSH